MRLNAALLPYRLLLPLLFLAAFPGWLLKMLKRNGLGTGLRERAAIYSDTSEFEPCHAIHVHAVSVGECLLAMKLIRAWRIREPDQTFVLATGTATGHQVATAAAIPGLRVTYSPLDFRSMVNRYLDRFEPQKIVLVEGEAWPHLLVACRHRGIPVSLVNARMSPRSARRYRRFANWVRPIFSHLDAVATQEAEDAAIWQDLGVPAARIHHTGSLKFDPGSGDAPATRPAFQQMLDHFGPGRNVVLAASTHPGEHVWIASAIRDSIPDALIAIVPRHAERRMEVMAELEHSGFTPRLRSTFDRQRPSGDHDLLVIDSTGELRDWTAHADVVVIGKSFLGHGGQNPSEAIRAGKPVIFGPHMENFEPLASRLVDAGGAHRATTRQQLGNAVLASLDPALASSMAEHANSVLNHHQGATGRIIDLIATTHPSAQSAV